MVDISTSLPFLVSDSIYELHGDKAFSFLHGQLTNHIKGMKDYEATFNFLLNNKGKIQAALTVYRLPNVCFVAVPKDCENVLVEHLNKLAGLSGVVLKPRLDLILLHAFDEAQTKELGVQYVVPYSRFRTKGFDCFVSSEMSAQFKVLSVQDGEELRIRSATPKFGVDYSSEHLPQETVLMQALHFDKGCYLGQEIVARLQYRGQIKKALMPFSVVLQDKIHSLQNLFNAGHQPVGSVTSFVCQETNHTVHGFVWLSLADLANPDGIYLNEKRVRFDPLALQTLVEKVRDKSNV